MGKKKTSPPPASFCSYTCIGWVVIILAISLSAMREYNIRGKKLWFAPVPTADLSINLEGTVAVVTGANTGIGLEISKGMAVMGADVIMACRSPKNGHKALESIQEDVKKMAEEYNHKPGSLEVIQMDLSSFSSVHSFVDKVKKRNPGRKGAVDILINNAALISNNTQTTEDGFRDMMGVNYFGPFLLTQLLLPDLLLSAQNQKIARVVNVASLLYQAGVINFEDIDHSSVDGYLYWHYIYGSSKAGNILFSETLAEKVDGSGLVVTSNHPGMIKTDITRSFKGIINNVGIWLSTPLSMAPWQGAQNTLYAATDPKVKQGAFYKWFEAIPPTWCFENVDEVREKLWEYSVERVGVKDFGSWKELL